MNQKCLLNFYKVSTQTNLQIKKLNITRLSEAAQCMLTVPSPRVTSPSNIRVVYITSVLTVFEQNSIYCFIQFYVWTIHWYFYMWL